MIFKCGVCGDWVSMPLHDVTSTVRLRPHCLVYTLERPQALPAVAAFIVGNAIGLPFIDKPVTVDTLAAGAYTRPLLSST